jgi:hypothetical protein
MDTIEHEAVSATAHVLFRNGFLVAKPEPDIKGTDLLAFMEMADGAKFCRLQVKGRSLPNRGSRNLKIPCSYVTNAFAVALYVVDGAERHHYCFLASDVWAWKRTRDQSAYRLNLTKATYRDKFKAFVFDEARIGLIRVLISQAEFHKEFRVLVQGVLHLPLAALRAQVTGTAAPPEK